MPGQKVLIVEDDKSTSLVIDQILTKKSYKISAIVPSGEEALLEIEKESPDIVLMDIFLKGKLDGIQTAEMISEKYDIPVIFISSYGEHKAIIDSKINQPFSFLLKPVDENELETSIQITLYRHKIDSILKSRERQFKMLADFSPDIIMLTDVKLKNNIYINKHEIFGYTQSEFSDLKLKNLFFDDDYKRMRAYWRKVNNSFGKLPPSIEAKIKCKNQGQVEWINLRQSIIEKDKKGGKKLLLTVVNNITEKKNAELDLIKTNFELDNFIYRASHDLSAPLKSVIGLVNLIKMEGEVQNQDKYLELILTSASKMDNYIFDMTNYARNNRLEIENELLNFEEIYQTQVNSLKGKDGFESTQKIFSLNQTSDFVSDSLRISILFNNLLCNSIKFQNQNKVDSHVKVSINITVEFANIVFSDNGIGIKPQYLERIFDMFFRASETAHGSGLGLYIAKQITQKLGGTIDVESDYGLGTTISIRIPNRLKFVSRY
ncbi:MAG: ATP-binding protein [Cytophagales bacterium]